LGNVGPPEPALLTNLSALILDIDYLMPLWKYLANYVRYLIITIPSPPSP